jgi:DNA-binding Lrp family transcriptional regulator
MRWYAVVPSEILSNKELSSSEKLLIGIFISLSNKTGYCFASNQYISEALGVSNAYVRSLIKQLESKKIITRENVSKNDTEIGSRTIRLADLKLMKEDFDDKGGDSGVSGGVIAGYQGGDSGVSPYNKVNNKENNKVNIITERFEEFWEGYGKKVGKEKAKSKWIKLTESEKDLVLLAIPKYKTLRPDPIFRKDPERYLMHRVWEDEMPITLEEKEKEKMASSGFTNYEITIPDKW